jgi:uncharacterized protein DUF4129
VIVLAAMIVVLILARLWSRRTPAEAADVEEVRRIDHGDGTVETPRRRSARRRPAVDPPGAVEAYQRLLADIDGRPNVRREPAETPGAHAARLRAAGRADLSLELLAADYALARFGGVTLTASEEQRAVGRWRRLRRTLGQPRS